MVFRTIPGGCLGFLPSTVCLVGDPDYSSLLTTLTGRSSISREKAIYGWISGGEAKQKNETRHLANSRIIQVLSGVMKPDSNT